MEDFPEELRTPPVSLVSLVGCPEIHHPVSAFLHSEQPPINTLALPDFSKISIFTRKHKDPLASPPPAGGFLKRDWLLKHRTRVPAVVAAVFRSDQVTGDPAQWLQVCTDLENLKALVRGRNIRVVVVLVLTNAAEEVSEDLMISLRKRAEIDSKYMITYIMNDATELKRSLNRLASTFAELCNTYYREEGRRIRARIEKKSFTSIELNVRYCFKVAVYAEFRRDWAEALRFYEEAYRVLREMIGTSTRLPPIQRLVEIRAVAEQLHFKISTLLFHGGKVIEAIGWFNKHTASYQKLMGPSEVAFLHWDWFSRQFLVFAELLETNSAPIPNPISYGFGTPDNPLTEWEFQPAYYYQLAARYLTEKRYLVDDLSSLTESELTSSFGNVPVSVLPSVFVGQSARLFEEGDTIEVLPLSDAEYISYAIAEAQRFQDSFEIIALFRKAYESFNNLKALRLAAYCSNRMAREYFVIEDFNNAKQLCDVTAALYRQEGWVTMLWESLGYLRECSGRLGSAKHFLEYSLEMASLPIFSNSGLEAPDTEREHGPAGAPTLTRREEIQTEVFRLLNGQDAPSLGNGACSLLGTEDQVICLDVDLVSPLRMVLLAYVAFHDQTIKPGSPTMVTLSLLSQLPHPLEFNKLAIEFNQPKCNFTIVSAMGDSSETKLDTDQDLRVEIAPSLILPSNKWLRLTYEIKSGESGKLECLVVKAEIHKHLIICCRAESPASMEDLPLWKYEDQVQTFPMKDPIISFSGQKFIQVEEPEPQVDLILDASGSALVGENFVIPVTVVPKGHAVHSGELKINLVDAKGGGYLMSPREAESFSSESHHVELLSISGAGDNNESITDLDNIRKIQHSFGVISVPSLGVGESWLCKLEIKWHRPKFVMLYVSLGYSPNNDKAVTQRINVHRSLQIEGKIPIVITHRFMTPFRREPLQLSKVKSLPGSNQEISLALNETNILIVSAQNHSEVPLRLLSLSIRSECVEGGKASCSLQHIGGTSASDALLIPGEEFKGVFSVTPMVESPNLEIGSVFLKWKREMTSGDFQDAAVVMSQNLPNVNVEKPPLVVSLECPPHAILGIPFSFYIRVQNLSNLLQEIKYSFGDSQSFVFSGPHDNVASILPKTEQLIRFKLVPLGSGSLQLPRITITSVRYSAALNPSVASSMVFVYPSDPKFEDRRDK